MSSALGRIVLAIPLALAIAVPALAGDLAPRAPLRPGDKLRLTGLDRSRTEGYLLETDGAQIRLRGEDGIERRVALSELTRIEVARRGRLRGAARDGLIYAGVFGFAGVMVLGLDQLTPRSLDGRTCHESGPLGGDFEYRCRGLKDVARYVGVGAALGAILGGLSNPERFVKVDARRLAIRVVPAPRGVAVQAAVGW